MPTGTFDFRGLGCHLDSYWRRVLSILHIRCRQILQRRGRRWCQTNMVHLSSGLLHCNALCLQVLPKRFRLLWDGWLGKWQNTQVSEYVSRTTLLVSGIPLVSIYWPTMFTLFPCAYRCIINIDSIMACILYCIS